MFVPPSSCAGQVVANPRGRSAATAGARDPCLTSAQKKLPHRTTATFIGSHSKRRFRTAPSPWPFQQLSLGLSKENVRTRSFVQLTPRSCMPAGVYREGDCRGGKVWQRFSATSRQHELQIGRPGGVSRGQMPQYVRSGSHENTSIPRRWFVYFRPGQCVHLFPAWLVWNGNPGPRGEP